MTDRIDHATQARKLIENARINARRDVTVEAAQVHATLALVEQQRIANLIALASQSSVLEEEMYTLRDEAAAALLHFELTPATPFSGPDDVASVRLDIREALGL